MAIVYSISTHPQYRRNINKLINTAPNTRLRKYAEWWRDKDNSLRSVIMHQVLLNKANNINGWDN